MKGDKIKQFHKLIHEGKTREEARDLAQVKDNTSKINLNKKLFEKACVKYGCKE